MAPTHRSSPAAGTPAGDGSGGGIGGGWEDGRGRSKRPLASPSASTSPHKRRKPPRAWARMLSQNPQTPHVPIHDDEISVGSGENCHICLDVGGDLCLLRQLMRGGPCELEVIGQTDCVVVNGTHINQFDQIILRGGDEVIFGQSGKHAYIFQHPLQDNKVTKAVLISADNSADTALENQSDPNPSDIIPMSGWHAFKDGLKQGILSPDDIKVTSGDHPCYVSGPTKEILSSSAFTHMEKEFSKCLQEMSSQNQRILLSSPSGTEMYQEALIKALAKRFDARLLMIDSLMLCGMYSKLHKKNTFGEGDRVEYIGYGLRSPAYGSRGKVLLAFEKNQFSKVGVRFDNPFTDGNDLGGLCEANQGFFCCAVELRPDSSRGEVDSFAVGKLLIEVISEESKSSKLIVLLKDAESLYAEWRGSLRSELPLGVLIIGSQTQSQRDKDQEVSGCKPERSFLNNHFPNKICIELPKNEAQLSFLKRLLLLEHDAEIFNAKANSGTTDEMRVALMHDALAVFPPAPRATIVYKDQYLDLLACGRAREPWVEAWRQLPLVLHDANLADAVEINLPEEYVNNDPNDLTEIISKVLKHHPGPIACLRLDCTACPGPGLLGDWMETLSMKQVQELVMVNATRPTNLDFPLWRLRSRNLRSLALGFFGLSVLVLDCWRNLASLRELNLVGCHFSGQALSAMIFFLPGLSSLTVGGCNVTAGCGRRGLEIESRSLTKLHLWECSASPVIIVKAPGLQVLITGVTPAPGTAAKVIIDLRSVEALQTLQRLGLHHHVVQISSKTTVKFNGQHVYSLPSLETLDVGIQVCVPQQALELMGLLGSLPRLRELTLWRVDDLPPHGEGDDDQVWREALVPPCTAQSLEHLVLRQYRGGAAEVALVRRVLSAATRLVSVKLHPHPTVPRKGVATPFRTCPAANRVVVEKHEKT